MPSRRVRVSFAERTGVLPALTTCFGPRTELAGLKGRTWPTTSQSKSIRSAARCFLTVAGERSRVSSSTYAVTTIGSTWARARPRRSHHSANWRTAARYARRVFGFRMWAVKNSQKRRSADSDGAKSAGVAAAGRWGRARGACGADEVGEHGAGVQGSTKAGQLQSRFAVTRHLRPIRRDRGPPARTDQRITTPSTVRTHWSPRTDTNTPPPSP